MPDFEHGLFGCLGNCTSCVFAYFCPCYVQGKIAERVGSSCCVHALLFLAPGVNIFCAARIRGKVRDQKGIGGGFIGDCLTFCFCPFCALAQEANEVNALGSMALSMARE